MSTIAEPRTADSAESTSGARAAVPDAPPSIPKARKPVPKAQADRSGRVIRLLEIVAIFGGVVLAAIGFTGSYDALRKFAESHSFGWFSPFFPIGVDAGIVVLLALDLYLIRRNTPWPVLRFLAHGFTLGTIIFNAASPKGPITADPVGALSHAAIPLMFIAAVEAARRVVIRAANIAAGRESDSIPLHRWVLAPWPTWLLYRRMRLWDIRSYSQAVEMERDRLVYQVELEREYGKRWRKRAGAVALLPLTMAPYGLSVEEALALPAEAEERKRLREEKAEAARLEAEQRAEQRAADREKARLLTQADVESTRAQAEANTATARAEAAGTQAEAEARAEAAARAAERAVTEAERRAELEREAEESAEAAAKLRKAAEDEKRAAEARQAAAVIDRRAAGTEKEAAVARAQAAEADRQEKAARAEAARLERQTAEDEQRAAEARERAAEAEARAAEADDLARLTPRERAARKVARMILAADNNAEAVDLQTISDALGGVSSTTASDRKKDALALIKSGYRPDMTGSYAHGT